MSRRPEVDPATFATELGILAIRGFEDMGKRARDLMIRNKFIAAQQSCELRRHLDGVSSDASIQDIVDKVIPGSRIIGEAAQTRNFLGQFTRWRRTPSHQLCRRRRYMKSGDSYCRRRQCRHRVRFRRTVSCSYSAYWG